MSGRTRAARLFGTNRRDITRDFKYQMKRLLHSKLNVGNGGSETNFRIERGNFFYSTISLCSLLLTGGPLTKPRSDSGWDWIGLLIGSDRIGRVSSLLVQNSYFEKSSFNNDTGGSHFFFRAACVTNKKVVSYVSPGLKFTISLKIMAMTYFQLNRTGKFSVAWLHTITIPKRGLVKWHRPNRNLSLVALILRFFPSLLFSELVFH